MYKDSKRKEIKIKISIILIFIVIFLTLLFIFRYYIINNLEYKEIWGEEKNTEVVEYIEEEIHPKNVTNNKIINNYSNDYEKNKEDNENITNISEYYTGTKNDLNISTNSNIKKIIPNYHTGKIFYNDINNNQ